MDSASVSYSVAFLGGLATLLTPCVYPLTPITLAVFGVQEGQSSRRTFGLALTYLLGLCVTYTALGMISALTGQIFGHLLGSPWVVCGLAVVMILLSLYTLDLFRLPFLGRIQSAAGRASAPGIPGILLMGGLSAFVAAPCAAPILIAILGLAAQSGSAATGAALLFVYSLGFGGAFVVLAGFAPLITRLPRAGEWFGIVKVVVAAALITIALNLIFPLLASSLPTFPLSRSSYLAAAVFALVLLASAWFAVRTKRAVLRAAFALCLGLTAFPLFGSSFRVLPANGNSEGLRWASDIRQATGAATADGKLVMVDFYADWCAACKELETKTFSNPSVAPALQEMSLARIDLTQQDESADALQQKYSLLGLPSVLFLCPNGSEIPESRIEGFLSPADFLEHVQQVKAKQRKC